MLPAGVALLAISTVLGAATVPLPEMAAPKIARPPAIDGRLSPGEWDRAAACTGFVKAFDGGLAQIQSTAWVAFDDRYIYAAFRNYRGEQVIFLSAKGRRTDDDRIVFDPANEVWISPPTTPATTYQTLFNVYPAVLDVKMIPSLGYSAKSWSGKWEIASSQTASGWTVEARAPIAAFGFAKIEDGSTWRALFATDVLADGDKFRAWAPGGAFADIPRHGFLHFTSEGPAFQLREVESIFTGKAALEIAVVGAAHAGSTVEVTARFGAGVEAAAGDLVVTKSIAVAAGTTAPFTLAADLTGRTQGFCEITAKAGGKILYRQVFPFVVNGFHRKPPATIQTTPYTQPFGLEASYAPLSKKLLVKIDRYYMADRKAIAGGRAQLLDPATGKAVAERPLSAFFEDYAEFAMDVGKLTVPVETEADWEKTHARKAGAEYRLAVTLVAKDGKELAAAQIPVKLLGYEFDWMPNRIGVSSRTIAPWMPVEHEGSKVSLWNKEYTLNGAGLAEQVANAGAAQLAGPMKLEAVADGRRVELAGQGTAGASSEAAAEFTGVVSGGGVRVHVATRVEFDGFVWNSMTVEPTKANVSRLSLVVDVPEREAPYLVTTSGGWSAYYGTTPARWDSRETSLTSMVGNFVPYIFLTDSERGFCWFADNEKGWRLDPSMPTQEVLRHDGLVTLRVNFINRGGPIEHEMRMEYGWTVTPQKPQPKGWRGYLIGYEKYYPQSTPVFWNDADWAVSWPYYSSPFPKDYEKSKKLLAGSTERGVVGCVGNIAHAIARYVDYHGRTFDALASEWGITPGDTGDGNVARSRGPNDFQLFHFDRWAKLSGLGCLYFDENYLGEDRNYLTGGAYLLADERVQPGYNYLGLREYNKRLRYMFQVNGKAAPNLWQHTTGGQAVYAWMPDVSMEAENVEPTDLVNDYMEALPASRLRSIGMGRNLGSAAFLMDQAGRHRQGEVSDALSHQLVGWALAHDVLPEGTAFWPVLASELELWREDVRFLPYWKRGQGIECETAGMEVSAHARPGNAVLWVVNENREDGRARIRVDAAKLGLDGGRAVVAYDAETGERYAVEAGKIELAVPRRMWRAVRLFQPKVLTGGVTLAATFDEEAGAVEAYGGRYPLGKSLPELTIGRVGKGIILNDAVRFLARQHVTPESGKITFAYRALSNGTGTLVSAGGLNLGVANGRIALIVGNKAINPLVTVYTSSTWSEVELSWQGREVQVIYNGARIFSATLAAALPLTGYGRGFEIRDLHRRSEPSQIVFGPFPGAVLDDLRLATKP